MSKFLTGSDLEEAIDKIIWDAERKLMIVSPYIKLDDHFKKLFDRHKNNPKIHLILIFGKNEKSVRKSMSKSDFDFFTKFPNISIIYVPNLHAKYYGNETSGVITSINLYDYSFINNIEFGVHSEQSIFDRFKASADNAAWDKCFDIAENNEIVFIKRPVYQTKKILVNLSKNYIKSDKLFDSTEKFYGLRKNKADTTKRLNDFPEELELGSSENERPERIREAKKSAAKPRKAKSQKTGFCIRSGKEIPFNAKQPLNKMSWEIWNKYGDKDFPEKFCHFSGEESDGDTSYSRPILRKNWKKAKDAFNL